MTRHLAIYCLKFLVFIWSTSKTMTYSRNCDDTTERIQRKKEIQAKREKTNTQINQLIILRYTSTLPIIIRLCLVGNPQPPQIPGQYKQRIQNLYECQKCSASDSLAPRKCFMLMEVLQDPN